MEVPYLQHICGMEKLVPRCSYNRDLETKKYRCHSNSLFGQNLVRYPLVLKMALDDKIDGKIYSLEENENRIRFFW